MAFWIFVPLVSEIFILIDRVLNPPNAVPIFDEVRHPFHNRVECIENVFLVPIRMTCEGRDDDRYRFLVRVAGKVCVAMAFENLTLPAEEF